MNIQHDESAQEFHFQGEEEKARLSYSLSDGVFDMQSTYVPPSMRGRGVARELVHAARDYAQERDYTIKASCWYARKVLDEEGQ